MAVLCGSGCLLVFLIVFGGSWWFLIVPVGFGGFGGVGGSWWFLVVLDSSECSWLSWI